MIDDKLRDILMNTLDLRVDSGQAYIYDTDEAVTGIKQLFKEHGWEESDGNS